MKTGVDGGIVRHAIGRDGSFSLRTVSGTVRLTGSQSDEVVLRARGVSGDDIPDLVVRRYEGGLHVEPERKGMSFLGGSIAVGQPDLDFEVELPASARVEISCISAAVRGSGLHGDQAYRLVSGELSLEDAGGRLAAKSVSGDMSAAATRPLEVDLATTSGDLAVEGARLELVRLRSVSGNVAIRGSLADGPEHRVETVSGDLQLEPTGGLTVEAGGPIVGLRSNIEGRTTSRHGWRGFVVGDGSAQLRFRSLSGDVTVEANGTSRVRPDGWQAAVPSAKAGNEPRSAGQLDILRAVERGELSVDEATRLLAEEPLDG